MVALLALGILSLVLCLAVTPIFRDLALKVRWVDVPDGDRKFHSRPIPAIGGLPIAFSYCLALALMLILAPLQARIFIQHKELLFSLIPAVAIVFLTGLVDDLIALKPWQKLGGQFLAAILAVLVGVRITLLDGHPYSSFITLPVSVLWLLACTNAFNLIDGLDGLASGVGLLATLAVLLAALLQGNIGLAMATVPLAGCLLGFLRYNFSPASIFLGDSGSLTIGFLLGCFGVIWSQKSATFLGILAPAMALALPLFDVLLSISRRFLRKQPIFQADSGHIHHRLLGLGFHPRTVALILYATCGLAAVLSLLQSSFGHHVGGLIVIMFCLLAAVGIKSLGYVEFSTVKRVLTGTVLHTVRSEIYLAHLREKLLRAEAPVDFWLQVRLACIEMRFASVHLLLDNELFEEAFVPVIGPTWQLSMTLGERGSIALQQGMHDSSQVLITSFFRVLHDCVQNKTSVDNTAPATKAKHAAA